MTEKEKTKIIPNILIGKIRATPPSIVMLVWIQFPQLCFTRLWLEVTQEPVQPLSQIVC